MAKLDKLSLDMIECAKAGFGFHYGAWKATQKPVEIKDPGIPEGWRVCAYCNMTFKPTTKRRQTYCGAYCQREALYERNREKRAREKEDGK